MSPPVESIDGLAVQCTHGLLDVKLLEKITILGHFCSEEKNLNLMLNHPYLCPESKILPGEALTGEVLRSGVAVASANQAGLGAPIRSCFPLMIQFFRSDVIVSSTRMGCRSRVSQLVDSSADRESSNHGAWRGRTTRRGSFSKVRG